MPAPLLAVALALLIALFAVPRLRDLAIRRGVVDAGDPGRAMHRTPVPRIGGVAVALAYFGALFLLWALGVDGSRWLVREPGTTAAIVLGGLAALGVGLWDDFFSLSPGRKLALQSAAAGLGAACGLDVPLLHLPVVGPIETGAFGPVLAMLWLVLVMNALNLVDGLDGLAAVVSLCIMLGLLPMSLQHGFAGAPLLAGALSGALLGFLRHNKHPASIFLGDSGSLFLGYQLAAWSLLAWQKSATGAALLATLLLFAVPLVDTAFAVLRRLYVGRPILQADAGHLHHQLVARGLSQRLVVALLGAAAACSALLAARG
jgi:UDP-GlcNAc:undecaprenyl-phosphate GlcNAc-1-phosphate transferase